MVNESNDVFSQFALDGAENRRELEEIVHSTPYKGDTEYVSPFLQERSRYWLDELVKAKQAEAVASEPVTELDRIAAGLPAPTMDYKESEQYVTAMVNNLEQKRISGERLNQEEFSYLYRNMALIRDREGQTTFMNSLSKIPKYIRENWNSMVENTPEAYAEGGLGRATASIVEGAAQGSYDDITSFYHSTDPRSVSFKFKQFLLGNDTFEEAYAQYNASADHLEYLEKLEKGEETLVFDPTTVNPKLVRASQAFIDFPMVVALGATVVSKGAASPLAGAVAGARGAAFARRAYKVAKMAEKATEYTLNAPFYAVGGAVKGAGKLVGTALEKGTGFTAKAINRISGGRVDENLANSVLVTTRTPLSAFGWLSGNAAAAKVAQAELLGIAATNVGAGLQAAGKSAMGLRTATDFLVEDAMTPRLARFYAKGVQKIDGIFPVVGLTMDGFKSAVIGYGYGAGLSWYSETQGDMFEGGARSAAGAGMGGVIGSGAARVARLNGRIGVYNEYDNLITKMRKSDPKAAENVEKFVGKFDSVGIETRQYVLGIPRLLSPNTQIAYVDGATFRREAGIEASGVYIAKKSEGINMLLINSDATDVDMANSIRNRPAANEAERQKNARTADAILKTGGTVGVHELFHGIISEYGHKQGFVNRLATHLFGLNLNGNSIIPTNVPKHQIRKFMEMYADDLKGDGTDPRAVAMSNAWRKKAMDGLTDWENSGKMSDGLKNAVEEFGAHYFEEWIKGKPLDYLFRRGDLGWFRNAFHASANYIKDVMADQLSSSGYTFDKTATSRGIQFNNRNLGYYDDNGRRVRDRVMDLIMEDLVRKTWNPPSETDVSTLTGDKLHAWATATNQLRRIYQDRAGVWRMMDDKQYNRREYERGQKFFSILKQMRDQGIDIGAEIVSENGEIKLQGLLNVAAIAQLKNEGVINSQEALIMVSVKEKIERGIDPANKLPTGLRFDYAALTEEYVDLDGRLRRKRRPKDVVEVKNRSAVPYYLEFKLTDKDRDGNKDEPKFVSMMTAIDQDAVNTRINDIIGGTIRMRNGKVVPIIKLMGGWALAKGKVNAYLRNLSSPNAVPSAALFGGGVVGSAIRDVCYNIVGSVPTKDTQMQNVPNASLPVNRRGPDFIFTTFRLDLMSMVEDTHVVFNFNEELAYPRTQANFKPFSENTGVNSRIRESVSEKDMEKPTFRMFYKNRAGKYIVRPDGTKVALKKYAMLQDGTQIFDLGTKVVVRSPLASEDLTFTNKTIKDKDGSERKVVAYTEIERFLERQEEFLKALNDNNVSDTYNGSRSEGTFGLRVIEFNKKYFLASNEPTTVVSNGLKTEYKLVDGVAYDSDTDALNSLRSVGKYIKAAKNKGITIALKEGKTIRGDAQSYSVLVEELNYMNKRNLNNRDAIPLVPMLDENGVPMLEAILDENKNPKYDKRTGQPRLKLKYHTVDYGLMAALGLTSVEDLQYNGAVSKYADIIRDHAVTAVKDSQVKAAITWYRKLRRDIVSIYGPAGNAFFEMLAANSPNEGPEQNFAYAVEAMELFTKGKYDAILEPAAKARDEIIRKVEDGTWRKEYVTWQARQYAVKTLQKAGISDPDAIRQRTEELLNKADAIALEAIGRLSSGRAYGTEISVQKQNELVQLYRSGQMDKNEAFLQMARTIGEQHNLARLFPSKQTLIKDAFGEVPKDARRTVLDENYQETGQYVTTLKSIVGDVANVLRREPREGQTEGKRFGMHNTGVAQVLLGLYERLNYGPKTYNYQLNLKGAGEMATIDIWAARYLRRIIQNDVNPEQPWRILGEAESGVSSKGEFISSRSNYDDKGAVDRESMRGIETLTMYTKADGDFFFGQDLFSEAAYKLRELGGDFADIEPHDLQALMWFSEKKHWADRNWTSGIGAEMSSYEAPLGEMMGNKALDTLRAFANLARIRIETGKPSLSRGAFDVKALNEANAGISKDVREMVKRDFSNDLVIATIGSVDGGVISGAEPHLVADFVLRNMQDDASVDNAFRTAIQVGIEMGRKQGVADVLVSERTTAAHPNARDAFTVFLNKSYELDSPDLKALVEALKGDDASFGGFSLEPNISMVGGRPQVSAINFQWIPEFDSTYKGIAFADKANVEVARDKFKTYVANALQRVGWSLASNGSKSRPDGSDTYVRGTDRVISGGIDLSRIITEIDHHFLNTLVLNTGEYGDSQPRVMGRNGLDIISNTRRHRNADEAYTAKQQSATEDGRFSPTKARYNSQGDSQTRGRSEETGARDVREGEEGVLRDVPLTDDGTVSTPEEAEQRIFAASRYVTSNGSEVIAIGPKGEFTVTRNVGPDGKLTKVWKVVHVNDKTVQKFESEDAAINYVKGRLNGVNPEKFRGYTYTDEQLRSNFIGAEYSRILSGKYGREALEMLDDLQVRFELDRFRNAIGGRLYLQNKEGRNIGYIKVRPVDDYRDKKTGNKRVVVDQSMIFGDGSYADEGAGGKYVGKGLGKLMYSEVGERMRALGYNLIEGKVVANDLAPLAIRQKVYGSARVTNARRTGVMKEGGRYYLDFDRANIRESLTGEPTQDPNVVSKLDLEGYYSPTKGNTVLTSAEVKQWRTTTDPVVKKTLLKKHLRAKGFKVDEPWYQGRAGTMEVPRSKRTNNVAKMWLANNYDEAAGWASVDRLRKEALGRDAEPLVNEMVIHKDAKFFSILAPDAVAKVDEIVRDPNWFKQARAEYNNEVNVERVGAYDKSHAQFLKEWDLMVREVEDGNRFREANFTFFEHSPIYLAVRDAGFDGYYEVEKEYGPKSEEDKVQLAIINPNVVKNLTEDSERDNLDVVDILTRGDLDNPNVRFSPMKGTKLVDGLWSGVLKELDRRDRKGMGSSKRDASLAASRQFRELSYDDADGTRRVVVYIDWGSNFGPTGQGAISQVWTMSSDGLTERKLLDASNYLINGQSGLAEMLGATKQPINLQEAAKFFKNADYWVEGEGTNAVSKKPSGLSPEQITQFKDSIADELTSIEGIEISQTDLKALFGNKNKGGIVSDIRRAAEAGDLEAYETAVDELEALKDELEQKQENTPEGLQDSDAYNNRAEAIDAIGELIDYLRDPSNEQ